MTHCATTTMVAKYWCQKSLQYDLTSNNDTKNPFPSVLYARTSKITTRFSFPNIYQLPPLFSIWLQSTLFLPTRTTQMYHAACNYWLCTVLCWSVFSPQSQSRSVDTCLKIPSLSVFHRLVVVLQNYASYSEFQPCKDEQSWLSLWT